MEYRAKRKWFENEVILPACGICLLAPFTAEWTWQIPPIRTGNNFSLHHQSEACWPLLPVTQTISLPRECRKLRSIKNTSSDDIKSLAWYSFSISFLWPKSMDMLVKLVFSHQTILLPCWHSIRRSFLSTHNNLFFKNMTLARIEPRIGILK
jgi:hypothetical protein